MDLNRISACVVLVVALALGACTAKSVGPDVTQSARTIGVMSAIGDDLLCQSLPVYMWQPRNDYRRDVAVWRIDPFVTEQVSRALQPRYSVVPVDFDRAAFLDRSLYESVSSTGTAPHAGPIGEVVRAHVHSPGADLYVVVLNGRRSVGLSRYYAEGMGVVRQHTPELDRTFYHTAYRIAVVDGHSFEPLAIRDALNDPDHPLDGLINGAPFAEVENQRWADERRAVTAEQVAWVMEGVKALFARTLPPTLRRLDLIAP
ncbi:MAG TPA: hypothetical protein VFG64_04370 [Dongiaceae bacterium]|nr:hypothetical protein [Dongiaceae bacterium]